MLKLVTTGVSLKWLSRDRVRPQFDHDHLATSRCRQASSCLSTLLSVFPPQISNFACNFIGMARQTTLYGADPFTLAASVYTTSISMNADSFCGIFDKTSSMHCGESAFCSYDTKVGRAGCCFTTTSGSTQSTFCPFHTGCIDHPGTLPSGCVMPCVNFESGIMSW